MYLPMTFELKILLHLVLILNLLQCVLLTIYRGVLSHTTYIRLFQGVS